MVYSCLIPSHWGRLFSIATKSKNVVNKYLVKSFSQRESLFLEHSYHLLTISLFILCLLK